MVKEAKRRKVSFKIMPVFLSTSLDRFHDPMNRKRWLSRWHELALGDKRVNVEEWDGALKYLHPINSIVYDGLGEVKFRKLIVDEVCRVVPPEMRLEDSHIQGRSRLCKVIEEEISVQQKGSNHGVCVLGLYGVGGIGKTSICKALCNEFFMKFRGRVCHAELERRSKEDLLREVLKKLTNVNRELLNEWKDHELLKALKSGFIKEAVFLALDNVSDTHESIIEAKTYLSATLPRGSIVMVTSRSQAMLMKMRPQVHESNCLQMPELDVEEAKSLFTISSNFELRTEDDEKLVMRCVELCHFRKNDGSGSSHYHPLTLDVLGKQLGCFDPREWQAQLHTIGAHIFNRSREASDPIFSILRKSFDALSPEDQLLFMDVAVFLPWHQREPLLYQRAAYNFNVFKWLGMVHRTSVDNVMRGLKRLKSKSLLESLGDGIETRLGMHDLWHSFCLAELKCGELRCRRWVFQDGMASTDSLVETSPPGSRWENVKRMAFFGDYAKLRFLEGRNLAHFSNVTVLRISVYHMREELVLDLSGLIHLRSLELTGQSDLHRLVPNGLPRSLIFLMMSVSIQCDIPCMRSESSDEVPRSSQQFVKQVGCLTELRHLQLSKYLGAKLPDMRSLISMRVAIFYGCKNADSVSGLSSKLSSLRVLDLGGCSQLRKCAGVGDLVALEELMFPGCEKLERLPNLGRLRNLRKLDIRDCLKLREVPGLGDLVGLVELYGGRFVSDYNVPFTFKLPDMRKVSKLRVLRLKRCPLKAVPGLENLISLQDLEVDFRYLAASSRPSLRQLTELRTLKIDGWSLEGLEELDKLAMLQSLEIRHCSGVDELPRFRSLINLQDLELTECGFKDVSSLSDLSALESLGICYCRELERLPDLQRLTRLEKLDIFSCNKLRGWDWTLPGSLVQGGGCSRWLEDTSDRSDLPESERLKGVRTVSLSMCKNLEVVMIIEALSQLQHFQCLFSPVSELPDLSNSPQLKTLNLSSCKSLRRLISSEPISALSRLDLDHCHSLTTLPDLFSFPGLQKLDLRGCEVIATLTCSRPLPALQLLNLNGCIRLNALPDLGLFPALEKLFLKGCTRLSTLTSSVPLLALSVLYVGVCSSLSEDSLDQLQVSCPQCEIKYDALHADDVGQTSWILRAVGAGAMILAMGWSFGTLIYRRSRVR